VNLNALNYFSYWNALTPAAQQQQQQQQHTANNKKKGLVPPTAKEVKEDMKTLKRAYYKKSLQWHPDRWVGLSQYSVAVQAAFELVHEAYDHLQQQMDDLQQLQKDLAEQQQQQKGEAPAPIFA
jgi:hypothetical protein